MAHLWIKNDSGQWAVLLLEADAFDLSTNPPRPLDGRVAGEHLASSTVLINAGADGRDVWALIAGLTSDVRVNGQPVSIGIRVVKDRDEIRVRPVGALYFSTERLARVEAFARFGQALYCPRCKQLLAENTAAVRCPQCNVWHHQTEELPCWTYSETCALCSQPTDLNSTFQWSPEDL